MNLSERDFLILQSVIRAHIRTGEPVSSLVVSEALGGDVSSATIRNTFAELDDAGYLYQPHTSAGRIPTSEAYALYAETLEHAHAANMLTLKRAMITASRLQDELHMLTGIFDGTIQHMSGFSSLLRDHETLDESCRVAIGDLLDAIIQNPSELLELPASHNVRIVVRGRDASGATLLVARAGPDKTLFAAGPMRMNYEHALYLLNI